MLRYARELARAARLQIYARYLEAVVRRGEFPKPRRVLRGARKQDADAAPRAAPYAAAELVELREAVALGRFYDDNARLRHVYSDLEHRRADEQLRRAASEVRERALFVRAIHLSVDERDFDGRQLLHEPFVTFDRGDRRAVSFLDARAYPVDAAARENFARGEAQQLRQLRVVREPRLYWRPSGGDGVDDREVEVAVESQRRRARYRRRAHHQQVGMRRVR